MASIDSRMHAVQDKALLSVGQLTTLEREVGSTALDELSIPDVRPVILAFKALDEVNLCGVDLTNVWLTDWNGELFKAEQVFVDHRLIAHCGIGHCLYDASTKFSPTPEGQSRALATIQETVEAWQQVFGNIPRVGTPVSWTEAVESRQLEGESLEKALLSLSPEQLDSLFETKKSLEDGDVVSVPPAGREKEIGEPSATDEVEGRVREYMRLLKRADWARTGKNVPNL